MCLEIWTRRIIQLSHIVDHIFQVQVNIFHLLSQLCCPKQGSDVVCDYTIYGPPWYQANLISHDSISVTISTKNCSSQVRVHSVPHNSNSLISNYRLFRSPPSAPKITPLTLLYRTKITKYLHISN